MTSLRRRPGRASTEQARLQPKRICILTAETPWTHPWSEASAGAVGLAQYYAAIGDVVTLLFVPTGEDAYRVPYGEFDSFAKLNFESYLIRSDVLRDPPGLLGGLYSREMASLAAFRYIQEKEFDAVYCALEGGLAYYSLVAAELGLFKDRPRIMVLASFPKLREAEADRRFLRNKQEIVTAHMEQYCAEQADELIASGEHLLHWMREKNWKLPRTATALPWHMPDQFAPPSSAESNVPQSSRCNEIVFISEPAFRNGPALFCDCLDKLAALVERPLRVSALGPFGNVLGEHSGSLLLRRGRAWPFEVMFYPRMTLVERLEYARQRGALVVIPNLEGSDRLIPLACLAHGVPFVASEASGTSDLIASRDRKLAVAKTDAAGLAERISKILESSPVAAGPHVSRFGTSELWMEHRARLKKPAPSTRSAPKQPLVSVVMAHYDRPDMVLEALDAIDNQDYPNLELIVVDDGSRKPETHAFLEKLGRKFKKKGWTLIRAENRYLGAARNTGVRKAKGEFILFVDDDNALFPEAVSTFVRAMQHSGADMCTAIALVFHQQRVPADRSLGVTHYVPLGGSLDINFINNAYGDANAMIRRTAFDKIGFQNELYGYTAQDWEFATRAAMAGLKVRVIPQPVYWYRSSPEGMFRTSNWYENRLPILEAYRKTGYKSLERLYDLVLSQNVDSGERDSLQHNLLYSPSNERLLKLGKLDPNSDEALELLAEIAATGGRPATAITLIGHITRPDFKKRVLESVLPGQPNNAVQIIEGLGAERKLLAQHLREAIVVVDRKVSGKVLCYTEGPDRLFLQARDSRPSAAVLGGICEAGTLEVTALVGLDQELAVPTQVILAMIPVDSDPLVELTTAGPEPESGNSGWTTLTRDFESKLLCARFPVATNADLNLVLGVRRATGGAKDATLAKFSGITIQRSLVLNDDQRPRLAAPAARQRARRVGSDTMRKAELMTTYESRFPLLQFPNDEEGLLLRPSRNGVVAVSLPQVMPPFSRGVAAFVEVAHEEASPFEFGLLIRAPSSVIDWAQDPPKGGAAFSGWLRVERKFELHKLEARLAEVTLGGHSACLAVRLPPNSNPIPSQTFWRKLAIFWDE